MQEIAVIAVEDRCTAEWQPAPSAHGAEPQWYAAYTCSHHEKSVALQLGHRAVEHFLPVCDVVRRWKDRRVTLQLPLFPGYVFVRLALRNQLQVLQIPGVSRLVGFGGKPAALATEEVEALRRSLAGGMKAEPYPYLALGQRVRAKSGPLAGVEGVLLRRKGSFRLVISIDLIQRSVSVDVDAADIEAAPSPRPSQPAKFGIQNAPGHPLPPVFSSRVSFDGS